MSNSPVLQHTIVHISDTHLVTNREPLHGAIDSDSQIIRLMEQLIRSRQRPDALIFSGDLADEGQLDAYQRLRTIVEPAAKAMETQVIWAMGNHDRREAFRVGLLDGEPTDDPIDSVTNVDDLRVVTLDSTVPGSHHGEIDSQQLDWLRAQLSEPAEHGTLVVIHHPPILSPLEALRDVELRDQDGLASVLAGTDVRGILSGHLHYPTTSLFAGVPVAVAPATSYSQDLFVAPGGIRGRDAGQGVNLVHVYTDRVVHSSVPIGDFASLYEMSATEIRDSIAAH